MHQWLGISRTRDRVRWLGQLSAALDEAQAALHRFGIVATDSPAAIKLYLQIEGARLEVRTLLRRSSARRPDKTNPNWTEPSPWSLRS